MLHCRIDQQAMQPHRARTCERIRSHRWLLFAVLASAVFCSSGLGGIGQSATAAELPLSPETSGARLVTLDTQKSIDLGLAWLAARQQDDGAFGSGTYRQNVAVTALSGMAFLSAGHTPGRGRYSDQVTRAIDFILDHCRPNGYIVEDDVRYHGPMYGHGFATLFLAEVYGMTPRDDVRQKLQKAVELIVASQNDEGGWRYYPETRDADVSVTVCQIMALRAARNAGIHVPRKTVEDCTEYVKKCQNGDGGFRYQLTRRAESLFPRSAAGVVALHSAGIYEGREVQRGLGFLMGHLPQGEFFRFDSHYFYGQYYAVQAMWQAGGDHWFTWYPAIRDEMLRRQLPNGSWPDSTVCSEYGTAMACLVLQMPNQYLPIFER